MLRQLSLSNLFTYLFALVTQTAHAITASLYSLTKQGLVNGRGKKSVHERLYREKVDKKKVASAPLTLSILIIRM